MEPALAALKTKGCQKTSVPSYFLDKSKGKWWLWLNFTTRKGAKPKLAFRLSWEASQRGRPCTPSKEDLDSASVTTDTSLPAGKS
ncbi:unnamed protein product [Ectocarpus sp. CCAP 1310/34]|nr:unnamed protein product [Ectocarpus sp. CCAP 1310/34]